MSPDHLLNALDEEQQRAVRATRGPVCIIAGAGTGKTRTITHRIAYAVATGVVAPENVLAVTHSQKAAGEMRERLHQLGVGGIAARTFHAAALKQLKFFWSATGRSGAPQLIDSRYTLVRRVLENGPAGRKAKGSVTTEQVLDVSSEIGWAKATLLSPREYPAAAAAARRSLPMGAKELADVYAAYEKAKDAAERIDFEDMLRLTADLLKTDADVAAQVREQYRYFVVDEYQDVDPLQQHLLEAWLGDRDELCIVGDPNQSVYAFKGAESGLILDFPRRYKDAEVVRLVKDYRSTPEVVSLANRISSAPRSSALVGMRKSGPAPQVQVLEDEVVEEAWVAKKVKSLIDGGMAANEIAILYRFNAQSARFEAALSAVGVPYNVVDTEKFYDRPEVRSVLIEFGKAARLEPEESGAYLLRLALAESGWDRDTPPSGAGAMRDRWEALLALLSMVEGMPDCENIPASDLLAELQHKAMESHTPSLSTVQLSTIHKAKGLEWDAVFVVRVTEGALPSAYAKSDEQVAEEKNLLYVAATRAREHLTITWSKKRENGWNSKPSRFLVELNLAQTPQRRRSSDDEKPWSGKARSTEPDLPPQRRTPDPERDRERFGTCEKCGAALQSVQAKRLERCGQCLTGAPALRYQRVHAWRSMKAKELKVQEATLLSEAAVLALVLDVPKDTKALARIPGMDVVKRRTWGAELLLELRNT